MTQKRQLEEKNKVLSKSRKPQTTPQHDGNPANDSGSISHLQRTAGNAAVQRLVAQRSGSGPTELDEDTTKAIQNNRSGGQPVDEHVAGRAEDVMGADFSNVQVHTDAQADQLSRKLNARAFTTGSDIFFREGEYAPRTSKGEQLLAHELTHVAQQGGTAETAVQSMRVNDPADHAEAEADRKADLVTSQSSEAVQRAEEEEEVQAQEEEEEVQAQEEEEEVQAQEEEEEVQAQEEEEEVQMKVQKQEFEEEIGD